MYNKDRHAKETTGAQPKNAFFKDTIETLKGETRKLKEQMSIDQSHFRSVGSESYIARLQDQGDAYTRKIEQERERKEALERRISELQGQIQLKRRQKIGSANEFSVEALNSKIKQIENKIDKSLQKYNAIVTKNNELRVEIDTLRREKVVSMNIKHGINEELERKQKELTALLDENSRALKQRDEAKKKLHQLKVEAEKEKEAFKRDYQELNRVIENEKKIKEHIGTRQERVKIEEPSQSSVIEDKILNDLKIATQGIKQDKKTIKQSVEKVDKYHKVFEDIKEATKTSDMKYWIHIFNETENQNYSLFSYVNELNNEIERLEKQIAAIQSEKDWHLTAHTDNQHKKLLLELENTLKRTEGQAEAYEKEYEAMVKEINGLKMGVQQILEKIGCNNASTEEMLRNQGVTEANIMQCLGIIELRTNEILQMYKYCQSGGPDNNSQPSNQKRTKPEAKKLDVEPPSVMEKDTEEDENIVWTKEKLKEKAALKLANLKKNK